MPLNALIVIHKVDLNTVRNMRNFNTYFEPVLVQSLQRQPAFQDYRHVQYKPRNTPV